MSASGIKVFTQASGVTVLENGDVALNVDYKYSTQIMGIDTGRVYVPMANKTESELNAISQEMVLAQVNAETQLTEGFVAADIIGGRV